MSTDKQKNTGPKKSILHDASKSTALFWIVVMYAASLAAAWLYLTNADINVDSTKDVLLHTLLADLIATFVIFIASRITRNSSCYDAYWSIIPPAIYHYWVWLSGRSLSEPLVLMVGIVIWYWAIRLTANWARFWTGFDHEDWRYPLLRDNAGKGEVLVDFFAIHFFPTLQVYLAMLPIYVVLFLGDSISYAIALFALFCGIAAPTIQLVADEQLHRFIATRKPGQIMQTGLWSWSRHPNYFGEILFWFSLLFFGLATYPAAFWWMSLGAIAMTMLFLFASIPMMEKRSLERRPEYQRIIESTSMLIPLPPRNAHNNDG